ncbi:MAG: hypothetical protein NZM04_08085 [Methylacidiphilales bacterium]|nr:hypothetical protein [Candidatus Methylacidiphilales bacterium]
MDSINRSDKVLFSLTRKQRLINPIERLIGILFFYMVMPTVIFFAIIKSTQASALPKPYYVWIFLFIAIAAVSMMILLATRSMVASFYQSIFAKQYINTIQFQGDQIHFGVDGIQYSWHIEMLGISKGFYGVLVLRNIPLAQAIIIPESAISYEDLKKKLEK